VPFAEAVVWLFHHQCFSTADLLKILPVLIAPVWNLARTGHRRSTTTTTTEAVIVVYAANE